MFRGGRVARSRSDFARVTELLTSLIHRSARQPHLSRSSSSHPHRRKGATSWTNHTDSALVERLRPEIKRFGEVLKVISALEPVFIMVPINKAREMGAALLWVAPALVHASLTPRSRSGALFPRPLVALMPGFNFARSICFA